MWQMVVLYSRSLQDGNWDNYINVSEYFEEIGAAMDVRAAFDALPGDPAMMRSYSKHTKIFLCQNHLKVLENFACYLG